MNDTKKPKPSKEIKHLTRIMGVASHAALSDNLPDWTSRKRLKKSIDYFLPRVEEERRRLGIPEPIELTEEQKKKIAEEVGKLIDIITHAEGAAQDENAE